MFEDDQTRYLARQLTANQLVLFLGAGFSVLATNRAGRSVPTAGDLARTLWDLLQTTDTYSGESLGEVYQAVLASGVSHKTLEVVLERELLCASVPVAYDAITIPFWYRIYTTNVDDLLPIAYARNGGPTLTVRSYPNDDITERDQSLGCIQAVYLNGKLPCGPEELTFSPRQYGRAAARPQPLYEQFVRDYTHRSVLFVGTRFEEPLFWQALSERGDRFGGGENRPRSFLVTRDMKLTKRLQLRELNVEPVEMEMPSFLDWLANLAGTLPSRKDVLRISAPDLALILEGSAALAASPRDLNRFAQSFSPVPLSAQSAEARSLYLLGAAPRWDDLLRELDAPREITNEIVEAIGNVLAGAPRTAVFAVLGSAGSGKSTIIRRAGLRMAQSGQLVFVTNSEALPAPEVVRNVLAAYDQRAILLFDNAEVALSQLPELIARCAALPQPPVFVIASRTNDFDRLWRRIDTDVVFSEFEVRHLTRGEIEQVLATLERNGLLGTLQGLSRSKQVAVFEDRARRQILIAMREATTSLGFDLIIRDEFEKLVPIEAQILYLCVALATDAGYRLTTDEFIGCSEVAPAEALALMARNLRDIVVQFGPDGKLLMLRHRLIANVVVDSYAPRALLKDAYVRLLASLAIYNRGNWRSRASGLSKSLLSHRVMYERFRGEIDEARAIFASLINAFGDDAHFWLQYGSLELEGVGGDLAFAENYLRQAEALKPADEYVQNALGHLLIKKGVYASDVESAAQLLKAGSEILKANMDRSQFKDAYAVHIYCSQRYEWAKRWLKGDHARRAELEQLISLLAEAMAVNPRHRRLSRLRDLLRRAYLYLAIPTHNRPVAPSAGDA